MPRVTVVIPNYNHARFLVQRIDSILNQTYTDFEVLYLDDASTDNSAEVFAYYENDPRIRTILNTKNSGSCYPQWNRGVRESRTEYVWIADADDYADPRMLEFLVEKLESHPKVSIAYCQSQNVDENGVMGPPSQYESNHWTTDYINDGRDEITQHLLYRNTIPTASAIVFRKSLYEAAGYADETMRLSADWMLWSKMLLTSDVAYVAKALNYYRQHSRSIRSQTKTRILIDEQYKIVKMINENMGLEVDRLEDCYEVMANYWIDQAYNTPPTISFKESRLLYSTGKSVDRKLGLRLLKKILRNSLVRMGMYGRSNRRRNHGSTA